MPYLFFKLDNYAITTMKNITDDSIADNPTYRMKIYDLLHHQNRFMRSTLNGTPCGMLQIFCKFDVISILLKLKYSIF